MRSGGVKRLWWSGCQARLLYFTTLILKLASVNKLLQIVYFLLQRRCKPYSGDSKIFILTDNYKNILTLHYLFCAALLITDHFIISWNFPYSIYGNISFLRGPHSDQIGSQSHLILHIFCITEQKSFVNIVSASHWVNDYCSLSTKNTECKLVSAYIVFIISLCFLQYFVIRRV